jgi:excinuclease UvrABC nuclease subunit
MPDATPVVYVCRNTDGDIIYVGSTTELKRRVTDHACKSDWWNEVTDVQHFPMPDIDTARQREADVIASIRPDYNIRGVHRDRTGVMNGTTGHRKNGARRLTRM